MIRTLLLLLITLPAFGAEPQLIVPPFQNTDDRGAGAGLETVLQDLLIARLSRAKAVAVLDREQLSRVLLEQQLAVSGLLDPATAAKSGKLLGASYVVLGSLLSKDDKLQIHARVVDVAAGKIIAAREVQGTPAELLQLGDSLGTQLLDDLHLKVDPAPVSLPTDLAPQANLAFMRGVASFLSGQFDDAQIQFMKARQFNPMYYDAWFWSGRTYYEQKQWTHAALEFERYLAHAPGPAQTESAKRFLAECEKKLTPEEKELLQALRERKTAN